MRINTVSALRNNQTNKLNTKNQSSEISFKKYRFTEDIHNMYSVDQEKFSIKLIGFPEEIVKKALRQAYVSSWGFIFPDDIPVYRNSKQNILNGRLNHIKIFENLEAKFKKALENDEPIRELAKEIENYKALGKTGIEKFDNDSLIAAGMAFNASY